ncbi:MAG: CoA-binding protein [Candidatus Schekmanbacteria bacterium]|nr:CoA-binding protein [Candidatus Schekmanbacteria bacterium]
MILHENPSDAELRRILAKSMTIAVVGCSDREERDSYRIARFLQERGHRIVPINPSCSSILGEPCYARLDLVPSDRRIDMINVFRKPKFVYQHLGEAIARGVAVAWLQLDVIDHDAAQMAVAAGCTVIMDRCVAIEYRRLFPSS